MLSVGNTWHIRSWEKRLSPRRASATGGSLVPLSPRRTPGSPNRRAPKSRGQALTIKAARRELISGGTPKARIQIKFRRRTDGDFCKIRVRGVKDKIAFDSDDCAWR